jgi:hypothetical protein
VGISSADIVMEYDLASKLNTVSVQVGTPLQTMTARVTTSDTPSYLAAPGNPKCQAYFGQGYNASDSSSAIPGASTANSLVIPGEQEAGRSLHDLFCMQAGNQCIADLEFF